MAKNESSTLKPDEIMQFLKLMEELQLDELELKTGEIALTIKRNFRDSEAGSTRFSGQEYDDKRCLDPVADKDSAGERLRQAPQAKEMEINTSPPEQFYTITAPTMGTFYRAKSPGEPPFVEVGGVVEEDNVVCIIEVMKLMNSVCSGVRGRVAKILVENGDLVEYKQPLIIVEPQREPDLSTKE